MTVEEREATLGGVGSALVTLAVLAIRELLIQRGG
jgi:hypothetical protein